MMGSQNPQQQDNSMAMLWIVAGIIILALIIWFYFQAAIVSGVFAIKHYEIKFLSLFTDKLDSVDELIRTADPKQVKVGELMAVCTAVGRYLAWICIPILASLALWIYLADYSRAFRKTFTMQRLVDQEKKNWPQITPVANLKLIDVSPFEGKWAMSLTPMEFCRKHGLLAEESEGPEAIPFDPREKETATLLKEKAGSVFAMQLGRHWRGVSALPMHMQALLAIFAARTNSDREPSNVLLDRIARSTASGKLDFTGTQELLAKHVDSKIIRSMIERHAYEYTVMASMLELARNDGVLPSADFLWLKPLDRTLWFTLNAVGRQTPVPEVGGIQAHWLAEKSIGRRLTVPMVDQAVVALELALEDIIYQPKEPKDG